MDTAAEPEAFELPGDWNDVVLLPTAESLASTVRPGKLSERGAVVVGGELIGESSRMVAWRGGSPIGAP
jgi:hypothetical protein